MDRDIITVKWQLTESVQYVVSLPELLFYQKEDSKMYGSLKL